MERTVRDQPPSSFSTVAMEVPFLSSSLLCFFLFLCTFDSLPTITSTSSPANQTDRLALLAFKDGITQDPLKTFTSWNTSLHFCDWRGVTCGRRHRRVTTLYLESQGLTGSISPFLANLSFLRVLNLQNNSFFGEIPHEIGHLFRLQDISLANNSLSGEIPVNISRCSNLMNLSFSYNNLVGKIPEELGSLSKLRILLLSVNNLTGHIPSSLGNLSSLYQLSLAFNNLEGSIPDALRRLMSLRFLILGANKLSGMVPRSLFNISSINAISLARNQLHGNLPQDIGLTLPNLRQLLIGSNQFTGPIPSSLSNASGFYTLSLNENNFVGLIPSSLGSLPALSWLGVGSNNLGNGVGAVDDLSFITSLTNCSNLERLAIPDNHFGGILPQSIANLSTKLTTLLLGRNQISGNFPTGIENLVGLSLLGGQYNLFTGSIPVGIGKLQMLSVFTLEGNKFSGEIPSSFGNLTQLSEFSLANNKLRGSIPSSLQNCRYLQYLDVSQNNLNGTIPGQTIGLSSLSITLNLSHNSFTGSLPLELGSLKNLGVMDISENRLSGEIPKALGDCLSLEILHLEGNLFHGSVPPSLISLKGLQDLDLSRNNLSGPIPKYLETLPFLHNLNLSFNSFEGDVPMKGVFTNASAISVVGNKQLCGGMSSLRLPACPIHKSKTRGGRSLSFRIIIAVVSVALCLILIVSLLTVYWRKKSSRIPPSTTSLGNSYLRVSYQELLEATNGFAPTNLIGVGSFGSVYKGILFRDEAPVAVKVLNLQHRDAGKSFVAECKVLRKIRHRNLLKIITSCSSLDFQGNDFKALVYEFMPNGSLEDWLHPNENGPRQSRNLSLEQRLNIAIDVASALDYLHHRCQTPIIHCDLKPSNVLLSDDLTAHVGDFGLAKFLSMTSSNSGEGHTSAVAIKGSIGYVAPEYGMGSEISKQGDVYSFGILLLEMFTGKRPTDDMFRDGQSLHNLAKFTLSEQVMEIVDSRLLIQEECEEATNDVENGRITIGKMQECFVSIIQIGVACSAESPNDRLDMNDVVLKVHAIKDALLGVGIHGNRQP